MKVWAYIDGFNLYNGAVRNTSWKWLDLQKFCQTLLPRDKIERIKYFTAKVDARINDPDQPFRQMLYWRALRTIDCLEIIEGRFLTKKVYLPLVNSVDKMKSDSLMGISLHGQKPDFAEVYRSECWLMSHARSHPSASVCNFAVSTKTLEMV